MKLVLLLEAKLKLFNFFTKIISYDHADYLLLLRLNFKLWTIKYFRNTREHPQRSNYKIRKEIPSSLIIEKINHLKSSFSWVDEVKCMRKFYLRLRSVSANIGT